MKKEKTKIFEEILVCIEKQQEIKTFDKLSIYSMRVKKYKKLKAELKKIPTRTGKFKVLRDEINNIQYDKVENYFYPEKSVRETILQKVRSI